jgi:hypothetical protein
MEKPKQKNRVKTLNKISSEMLFIGKKLESGKKLLKTRTQVWKSKQIVIWCTEAQWVNLFVHGVG